MVSVISAVFPPAPTVTEKDLKSLESKVYIVTGAASGVGFALAKILYSVNATVYIAARSSARCANAIALLQDAVPNSAGTLKAMVIDLADLTTVKPAVAKFLATETRLDGLVHNAGVMEPPAGSRSTQGHDLEVATHCIAPHLLTRLLQPVLAQTAKLRAAEPYSVRVVWVVTIFHDARKASTKFADNGTPEVLKSSFDNYMQSKIGEAWLATKWAAKLESDGLLSVSVHPGLMRTELQRTMPAIARGVMRVLSKPATYGAYSELFSLMSPEVSVEHNGCYIIAWGRIVPFPEFVESGFRSKQDGGSGNAEIMWDFCEAKSRNFA